MEKLLIAGIDPGTTNAFCLIDLEGNVVSIGSGRELSHGRILSEITKHGKVFALGSDVYPSPNLTKKIASILGARVISPDHDLSYLEKIKIVDSFLKKKKEKINIQNKHEKDALAAAIYGLKRISSLIKKIDDNLKQNNKTHIHEQVKRKVLLENMPISDAVKILSS